ncbi:DegT/DnrJ/EryC1/StrS family aminotransferase [Emcibacter sp.]|uniref:DegT/DnrJ/EryC1/StrS family aminotransferase n=1 Tax=Emcibacter sp. TaxID=1979954 RepID=UPI003A91413F
MSKLALLGGQPVRSEFFPAHNFIGDAEKKKVMEVLDSGVLSKFLGVWHKDFFGGAEVQAFEKQWAVDYKAKHAISVNSCTSGLYAAVGAAGVGPGDEVIVSPYTMAASVTAAIAFNAVPVFADIDPKSYCISPETIRKVLTPRTKAIIVVHIFGQPAEMDGIMEIAREHNLVVIEDCAQAPCASYKGRPVGTLGHMGVFSLNYHKHIHSGEGGIITTNDDSYCDRLQLIRNHAEAVLQGREVDSLVNMVGFNFRLGEIEAAIASVQNEKSRELVEKRRHNVAYLSEQLKGLPGIRLPEVPDYVEHSYYMHVLRYMESETGIRRDTFVRAVRAELPEMKLREGEGALIGQGYVKPIYLYPMFREQIAYGSVQCPFKCPHYKGKQDYKAGMCPNVEDAHATVITHELVRPSLSKKDLDDVVAAFHKVSESLGELKAVDQQ